MTRYATYFSVLCIGNIAMGAASAICPPGNSTSLSAKAILTRGINAVGGAKALRDMTGISYHSMLERTQSLEESVTPGSPNTGVVVQGSQTISYDFTTNSSSVVQRIDKKYIIGDFFNFARPNLDPFDVALVVKGGDDGYACYVKGNEHVFNPPDSAFGYTDRPSASVSTLYGLPTLPRVLVRDAIRLSPKLLLDFQSRQSALSASEIYYHNAGPYPAVHDKTLDITVIFDQETYLPFVVRAYENHLIFGNSTNDFVLGNYTSVDGIQVPRLVHTLYNERNMLLHSLRDVISINPVFPNKYFDGIDASLIGQTGSQLPPSPAKVSTEYGTAEVYENNHNLVWYGPYQDTLNTLNVTQPVAELPNLYHLVFEGSIYTCTVGVFDHAIIVADAAPHQSKLVIQWIQETFHRNPTHLLVSHHHHDHNYGAVDFVAAGASLVVPDAYKYYWQNIPGVKFSIVRDGEPFEFKDRKMQVRAMWHPGFVHADDWMYFMWTTSCPTADSPVVATIADAWSPGFIGYEFDNNLAISYLNFALQDGMPHNYLVVPIHGTPHNITELYTLTGYVYPNYKTTGFNQGSPLC